MVALDDVEDTVGKTGLGVDLGQSKAVRGVSSAGLKTIELPQARAGPDFQQAIWIG